jgi:hypothetical protein
MPLLALLLAGTLCNNAAMIARWPAGLGLAVSGLY